MFPMKLGAWETGLVLEGLRLNIRFKISSYEVPNTFSSLIMHYVS